jgi:GT2 family glycosyltransferase
MPVDASSWALVVATYNREELLPRCLRLGAAQTRPPLEIVVVDSSPGWEKTRDRVLREIAPRHTGIRWRYVEAERRSSASQRNQGVRLATADVVFLIDDDSLMYPDCAAEIMRVYDADRGRSVVGVNATNVPVPPDATEPEALPPATEHTTAKSYGRVATLVRRLLAADDIFIPYDEDFPAHPVPPEVAALSVERWQLAGGWGMTFRREVCLAEPFADILINYAATEDSDMSYRATRRGVYVGARNARLCHLGVGSGRVPTFVWAASNMLNPVILHALHGADRERSRRLSRRLLARRVVLSAAKDVYYRRWSLPTARGALLALSMVGTVFSKTEQEIRDWYPGFQARLNRTNASR